MPQVTEAVYSGGVLKPSVPLNLQESQRVRLIIEPITEATPGARSQALERLKKGIQSMKFRSKGPLPSRQELHDRS
jgi:predicted DNA-binding antitoxin AbrB/MazE fold protein